MTDLFVIAITMWGFTAQGDWVFIGNQYINNKPMPLELCEAFIDDKRWTSQITSQYYAIQFDCFHVKDPAK